MKLTRAALMLALLGTLFLAVFTAGAGEGPKKINVLLLTGDDVEPAHNWAEVSQAIKGVLVSSGKFDVKVCEDAGVLDSSSSLARYDVIFMHLYNAKTPPPSDKAKENLLSFVKNGKGFVVSHLSSASYKDWPEFRTMCGRYWVMGTSGHGPRSVFKVRMANKNDPIVGDSGDFETDDELYAKLQGDGPINVLVEADSEWSKKTEPLAFTLKYGQGRVFHQAFGHDGKAIKHAPVARLIQRGCEWAATGKVD